MTQPSDFTDIELGWLVEAEKYLVAVKPPEKIEAKLVGSGVLDRTELGLKITGLGKLIVAEARQSGRVGARISPRPE